MLYFNAHTHINYENAICNAALGLTQFNKNCYYSIGIHPWDYEKYNCETDNLQQWLCSNVNMPQVLAIGECGLDRSIDVDIELQKNLFLLHVELAQKNNKPLLIHSVRAYSDILQILHATKFKQAIVFHKFMGNAQVCKSFENFNCYYSFGNELFTRSQSVEILQMLPLNKVFFENDNSNISIDEIYEFAAQKLQISVEKLGSIVQENAETTFQLPVIL